MIETDSTPKFEISIESPVDARAALAGGADRVELCAALALGGVTPSPEMIAATVRVGLPVHVLIRPFAGGFCYADDIAQTVAHDIRNFISLGIAGVVVGALTRDHKLDRDLLASWRDAAAGVEMTLHRAIDLCAAPVDAVDQAAALGIDRILTSGGARTAHEGARVIAAMVVRSAGRVEIMAGSGVTADNVRALVDATGVTSVHASASALQPWPDPRIEDFGFGSPVSRATDPLRVGAIRAAMPK